MERPNIENTPIGHIEGVTIPDEDVRDWIRTLKENGFSKEEIKMLLNDTDPEYAEQNLPERLRDALHNAVKLLERGRDSELTPGEKMELIKKARTLLK